MRGTDRCDEIVRLIDTALEAGAPATPPVPSPAARHEPRPARRVVVHGPAHAGWLRRVPLRLHRRDPRFVAPPASAPSGPPRFAPGLRTAAELTGRSFPAAPVLPEAG